MEMLLLIYLYACNLEDCDASQYNHAPIASVTRFISYTSEAFFSVCRNL